MRVFDQLTPINPSRYSHYWNVIGQCHRNVRPVLKTASRNGPTTFHHFHSTKPSCNPVRIIARRQATGGRIERLPSTRRSLVVHRRFDYAVPDPVALVRINRSVLVPSPNWPTVSLPHQHTPTEVQPQVREAPTANAQTHVHRVLAQAQKICGVAETLERAVPKSHEH